MARSSSGHRELNPAVIQEEHVPGFHGFRKLRRSRRDPSRFSNEVADFDHEVGTGRQMQRPPARQPSGANLGSAEILQDRDWPACRCCGASDPISRGAMTLVSAV